MTKILTIITFLSLATLSCFGGEAMIHPSFNLDNAALEQIIAGEKEEIYTAIMSEPERFLELSHFLLSQPEELFYLADKNHAVNRDQAPKKTVKPSEYGIISTRAEREVSSLIINSLLEMVEAAREEDLELVFGSGYRPYDYQEMLYNRYVKQYGQEEADRFSAKPGTSQHQLGTAVDFSPISDELALMDEGKWLAANAADFGFTLSYPKGMESVTGYMWECWHFRYITKEGVAMEREFFLGIQQYFMEFWHYHKEELKSAWRQSDSEAASL